MPPLSSNEARLPFSPSLVKGARGELVRAPLTGRECCGMLAPWYRLVVVPPMQDFASVIRAERRGERRAKGVGELWSRWTPSSRRRRARTSWRRTSNHPMTISAVPTKSSAGSRRPRLPSQHRLPPGPWHSPRPRRVSMGGRPVCTRGVAHRLMHQRRRPSEGTRGLEQRNLGPACRAGGSPAADPRREAASLPSTATTVVTPGQVSQFSASQDGVYRAGERLSKLRSAAAAMPTRSPSSELPYSLSGRQPDWPSL